MQDFGPMFSSPHAVSKNRANNTKESPSCRNCHYFHRFYIHKYLLSKCQVFCKILPEHGDLCDFWTKRYHPPHRYLTIKE
jgi:hypothetical protein